MILHIKRWLGIVLIACGGFGLTVGAADTTKPLFDNRPLTKERVGPVEMIGLAPNNFFVDFGRAAFGTVELTIDSPVGNRSIEVHLGEVLAGKHIIDRKPGGSRRYRRMTLPIEAGLHTYTVAITPDARNTSGAAVLLPKEVGEVMPFRYCELVGVPGELKNISQIAVHYPFNDKAAEFHSSDQVLNQVWDLCKYSIKATTFAGVYVDGDRERIPYEGDAYINQLGHYCLDHEYAMARRTIEHLFANPTWPAEWQMHMPMMAWAEYLYTGDTNLLAQHYDDLSLKTLSALAREDGLIVEDKAKMTPEFHRSLNLKQGMHVLVDWPATSKARADGERDGYDMRPVNTVANAFHYRTLVLMEKIADALGRSSDAKKWGAQAARVRTSFNAVFFDAKNKRYVDGENSTHSALHANMFPLAFGLVPETNVADVVEFIKSRGMACSVYGSQHLLEGLFGAGAEDYALSLLTATNDRSWLHMIEAGSTITMEAWDNKYKENQDWNHAWGAAPANIIPRLLMGIEPIEPGCKRIRIRPQIASLKEASIVTPILQGPVSVAIKQEAELWDAQITVPDGTVAEVHVPTAKRASVSANATAKGSRKPKFLRIDRGRAVFDVPGGSYSFKVKTENAGKRASSAKTEPLKMADLRKAKIGAVSAFEVSDYVFGGYEGDFPSPPHADNNPKKAIVVCWKNFPFRFVFSHEGSYCPWFEFPSGAAHCFQFFEGNDGWAELFNDYGRKETNSFVELREAGPDRVWVRWNYFGVNQNGGERAYHAVEDFWAYPNGHILRRQSFESLMRGDQRGYAREPIEMIGMCPKGKLFFDVLQEDATIGASHALAVLDVFSTNRYDVFWRRTSEKSWETIRVRNGSNWKTLDDSPGVALVTPMKEGSVFCVMGDAGGFGHEFTRIKEHSHTDTGGLGWGSQSWDHWPIGWLNSQAHEVGSETLPKYPNHFSPAGMDLFALPNEQVEHRDFYSLIGVGAKDLESVRKLGKKWLTAGPKLTGAKAISRLEPTYRASN